VELILNWLWQGGVVALATAGLLRVIPLSRPQARYRAAWASCAAVLALPLVPPVWAAALSPAAGGSLAPVAPVVSMPVAWWTSTTLALGAWALWVAVQALRVTTAATALRRAKRQCREFPAQVEARLAHWTRLNATGRRARLVLSDRVTAAAVLGGASPLIAVAPPLLGRLGDADLDRIVVHEWAHVQRRDDVAQAVQLLVRALAGWHPAIWWLERQLHLEREVACDEAVVAVTGSAKGYAACLTTLAGLPVSALRRLPVMAAASPSGLSRRIVRILATRHAVASSCRATALLGALAVGTLTLGVGNLPVVRTAFSSPPAPGAVALSAAGVVAPPGRVAMPAVPHARPTDEPTPVGVRSSRRAASEAEGHAAARVTEGAVQPALEPEPSAAATVPQPASEPIAGLLLAPAMLAPLGPPAAPAPGTAMPAPDGPPVAGDDAPEIWGAAADAGKAIGRRSGDAAVVTARLFTRFGSTIASAFRGSHASTSR